MDRAVRVAIQKIFGNDNFVSKIQAHRCHASLRGIAEPDRLIVSVDLYTRSKACGSKRCDFVLFFPHSSNDKMVCVLIELKSGEFDVDDVVEQLQCTARYLETFLELNRKLRAELILCPLLLCTRGPHSTEQRKLKEATIRFCNSRIPIFKGRCGLEGNIMAALKHVFKHRNS